MIKFRFYSSPTVATLLFALIVLLPVSNMATAIEEHFSVKEYEQFHHVLHPLQHEALPNKDFRRMRLEAGELVKRGKAIVRLKVPANVAKGSVEEFQKELQKFGSALNKFNQNAKTGSDSQLEDSFSSLHDSFEMLIGMLPRK